MRKINSNIKNEAVNTVINTFKIATVIRKNIRWGEFMKKVDEIVDENFSRIPISYARDGEMIKRIGRERLKRYAADMVNFDGDTEIHTEVFNVYQVIKEGMKAYSSIDDEDLEKYIRWNKLGGMSAEDVKANFEAAISGFFKGYVIEETAVEFYELLGFEINGVMACYTGKTRESALPSRIEKTDYEVVDAAIIDKADMANIINGIMKNAMEYGFFRVKGDTLNDRVEYIKRCISNVIKDTIIDNSRFKFVPDVIVGHEFDEMIIESFYTNSAEWMWDANGFKL